MATTLQLHLLRCGVFIVGTERTQSRRGYAHGNGHRIRSKDKLRYAPSCSFMEVRSHYAIKAIYIPCLCVITRKEYIRLSCFKLMSVIGFLDVFLMPLSGFLTYIPALCVLLKSSILEVSLRFTEQCTARILDLSTPSVRSLQVCP